jgi:hypothetical protein
VLGQASVRVTPAALDGLRRKPGTVPGKALPAGFLKHADEQTVVGLAAVLQAIETNDQAAMRFTEWGVVAVPRFLGRVTLAQALERFAAEGAWGVSPHLIPHRSLHSISGTVSQALTIRGPNFGAGGGPGGVLEGIRTATAMLHGDKVPGVWLVLTGWDPEPIPDGSGVLPAEAHCIGLALALTADCPARKGSRLRLTSSEPGRKIEAKSQRKDTPNLLNLETLMAAVSVPDFKRAAVVWQLEDGGRLELEYADGPKGLAGPHGWAAANRRVAVGSSGAGAENSL